MFSCFLPQGPERGRLFFGTWDGAQDLSADLHTFYKSSTFIKSLIPLDGVVGRHGHLPGSMLALCQHRLPRPLHHPTLDLTMKRGTTKLQIPSPAGIVGVGREVEKRHFYLEQGIQPALETKFYLAISKPVFFHPSFPLPLNMFTQISSSMKSKGIVILHFNLKGLHASALFLFKRSLPWLSATPDTFTSLPRLQRHKQ